MRLRTLVLSFSAFFALLYPLLTWEKERIFSFIPIMESIAAGWFWIAEPLLFTLFLFVSAAVIRQKILQYVCIIAASFFLSFAMAEIYFKLLNINYLKREYLSSDSVYVQSGQATHLQEIDGSSPDPILGHGPNPNARKVAARLVRGNKVIYDALYSRDKEGRRITPDRGDKADTAILLFGCSYTMGHGLNDRESFAWQLGEMLGEKFQVFNFGYDGYGAHQILALIESGRLDALARRYKQIYAFYLTVFVHEMRCVAVWPWNYDGPRYILENGALKYAGRLNERPKLTKFFSSSQVYVRLKRTYHRHLAPYSALDIHTAIVVKSMHEMNARYHAHALTVIWPDFTRLEPVLRDRGVRILPLTGAMPDYSPEKYEIKDDGHPNALANTRIAEALSEYILKHPQAMGEQR